MLAFESDEFTWTVKPGQKVKMGQALGYVRYSPEVEAICYGKEESECTVVKMEEGSDSDEQQSVGVPEEVNMMDDESIELEETENYRLEEVEEVEEEETQITPVYRMKSIRKIVSGFAQRS